MTSVLDLLEKAGAFVGGEKQRGRGRPSLNDRSFLALVSLKGGPFAIAYEVATEVEKLGGREKRGNVAEAIRRVSEKYSKRNDIKRPFVSPVQVQTYYKRHRDRLDNLVKGEFYLSAIGEELERRMMGFPDDVAAAMNELPAVALLRWLRDNNIDGTCPDELIAEVRRSKE